MKEKLYAVYRGDVFEDCGTARELVERLGVSVSTIQSSMSHQKRRAIEGKKVLENARQWYAIDDY